MALALVLMHLIAPVGIGTGAVVSAGTVVLVTAIALLDKSLLVYWPGSSSEKSIVFPYTRGEVLSLDREGLT